MSESGSGKPKGGVNRRDLLKAFSVVPAAWIPVGAVAADMNKRQPSNGGGNSHLVVRIDGRREITSAPVVADAIPILKKSLSDQGYQLAERGGASAIPIRLALAPASARAEASVKSPQRFSWEPMPAGGGTLTAPEPLSLEAGLLWLADRVACNGKIPPGAHKAVRSFSRSLAYLSASSQGISRQVIAKDLESFRRDMLVAARGGATDVVVRGTNRVVVWEPVLRPQVERHRKFLKAAAEEAQQLGLGFFLYGDELIYQPAWLKAHGARLSTSDPKLWRALASKYREVLAALPGIDGIMTRAGEVIPWPGVLPFDLIHDRGDKGDRGIVDNYREFLQTLHGVIVGEFGKEYVHRTWATNNYEQASVPEIYQEIFNSQLPTKKLFAGIKLTLCDQWEWQPLNPTFGVTPHATIATIEINRCTSPILDYAMPFVQSGMQWARERGAVGLLGGVAPDQFHQDVSDTAIDESVAYCIWRLSWTPNADFHSIQRDWAKRRLGPAVADQVADLLPSLGDLVRDCWYLQPLVDLQWNPQQLFGGAHFVLRGNPIFDHGAGQDRFLRGIYLNCKPWMRETMSQVAAGVWRYDEVLSRLDRLTPAFSDPGVGKAWRQRIWRVREAFNMYRAYVQTFLICFAYRDTPTRKLHEELAYRLTDLKKTFSVYEKEPGHFRLGAVQIVMDIASRALANREALERYLAAAPTPQEIAAKLRAAEAHDAAMARSCPSAQTFLSWSGSVDGREILVIRGKELTDDHQTGNLAHNIDCKIVQSIPARHLTYFLVRHSGRGWTVLLQSPSPDNGWTAKIYVDDPEPSEDVYRFELKGIENCEVSSHSTASS